MAPAVLPRSVPPFRNKSLGGLSKPFSRGRNKLNRGFVTGRKLPRPWNGKAARHEKRL